MRNISRNIKTLLHKTLIRPLLTYGAETLVLSEQDEHRLSISYVYWTVHHIDSWIKRDQLHVTCFIISLFNAQHVSDVNTSILRCLRLICYFMGCIALVRCVLVLRCGLGGVVWYPDAGWTTSACIQFLRMDVLTSRTCWALNNKIKKQVTSSRSLFIQQWHPLV